MRKTLLSLLVLTACDATPDSTTTDWLSALPPQKGLEMALPGPQPRYIIGQVADFYEVTRGVSSQLNGLVGQVTGTIGQISQNPPSAQDADHALWGPFTPALSPVTYRLVVERVAPDQMRFHLDARPKAAGDDAFLPFVMGQPLPAGQGRSAGQFAIDMDLGHALDPQANPTGGHIAFQFDVGPDAAIAVQTDNAAYHFTQAQDGSGTFRFAQLDDMLVVSHWDATGAGRADAHLPGNAQAAECWNAEFLRVFFAITPQVGQPQSEGDPNACAL